MACGDNVCDSLHIHTGCYPFITQELQFVPLYQHIHSLYLHYTYRNVHCYFTLLMRYFADCNLTHNGLEQLKGEVMMIFRMNYSYIYFMYKNK